MLTRTRPDGYVQQIPETDPEREIMRSAIEHAMRLWLREAQRWSIREWDKDALLIHVEDITKVKDDTDLFAAMFEVPKQTVKIRVFWCDHKPDGHKLQFEMEHYDGESRPPARSMDWLIHPPILYLPLVGVTHGE